MKPVSPSYSFPMRTADPQHNPIQLARGLYGIAGPKTPGNATSRREETLRAARALLAAGVPVLQLRDKWSTSRELLETARHLRQETARANVLFIVNDRADIALMSNADGVHVGQDDLSVEDVRRYISTSSPSSPPDRASPPSPRAPRPFVVGVSTHNLDQIRTAVKAGADYLGFGPIFETRTKENPHAVRGTELLTKAVALASPIPVVAIGGITRETAEEVARTKVPLAAVIGDVVNHERPEERAREIHTILQREQPF